MKVIVTGSKGFVGANIVERLLALGHCVQGFDLPENDILDPDSNLFNGADVVVHCAAIANLNDSIKDIEKNFRVNVQGTWEIAAAARSVGARMLYISTCCAYGNPKAHGLVEMEDFTVPCPTEPYAMSKLCAEYAMKSMFGLDWCIFRIGTVYGPGMRKELFNYIAMDAVDKGNPITIHGSGRQTRNYVYVDDISFCIGQALKDFPSGETINVCGHESVSVMDTIKTCEKVTGKAALVIHGEDRPGQIHIEKISNDKSISLFGVTYMPYELGMAKTYGWYKVKT